MASSEDILNRLDILKKSFHPALQTGGRALASFHTSFKTLISDSALRTADERTQDSIRSFVNTVTTISSALLEIETASQPIYEELEREIARIAQVDFKRLSLSDIPATTSQAPYIECCYTWLLGHLHNPYPSKAIRQQFALHSGAQEKDIDAWFIEARKRIGWNEIRRAYFDTRFDMVKAATRHFHPTSRRVRRSADILSLPDDKELNDYTYHFVNMENNARSWYSHKFFPTSLATNLERSIKQSQTQQDAAVSYPSPRRTPSYGPDEPDSSTSVSDRRKRRRYSDTESECALNEESRRPQRPLKRTRLSTPSTTYAASPSSIPSPAPSVLWEHSFSMSPSVAPSPLEEEELTVLTTQYEKRKRRPSDASDYDSESSRAPRARRRRRVAENDGELEMPRKIPTPKRTLQMSDTSREPPLSHAGSSSQLPTVPTPSASQTLKRKRRLSDAQDQRPQKLPHHVALSLPRLQTVSNPLPLPSLFMDLEDIPTTLSAEVLPFVDAVDLDDLQNLDVESFDFGSLPLLKEYLSQSDAASQNPGNSEPSTRTPTVVSKAQNSSQLYLPASASNHFPLLSLDFAPTGQLSVPPYIDLFPDIQGGPNINAPEIWQDFSLTVDKQLPAVLDHSFESTLAYDTNMLQAQPSGINPFDLILYPPIASVEHVNSLAMDPFGSIALAPSSHNATMTSLALQEIEKLQAQVQMYQAQLAQAGVSPF